MTQPALTEAWPLFGLRVRTPRLELRLPTDEEIAALIDVVNDGVHPPGETPFLVNWAERPHPERERGVFQHHWRARAAWTPERWTFMPAVFVDGAPVGAQDVSASHFAVRRVVESGSWLGQRFQGQGIGTEMRAAMLHLAFEGLGARMAVSGYRDGNLSSQRVSEKNGYVDNGIDFHDRDDDTGEVTLVRNVRLMRERWLELRRDDIEIEGLGPCLALFGAGD